MQRRSSKWKPGGKPKRWPKSWGISKYTLYAWRAKYGGLAKKDLRKVKDLDEENRRLKRLVADLSPGGLKWSLKKTDVARSSTGNGSRHARTVSSVEPTESL